MFYNKIITKKVKGAAALVTLIIVSTVLLLSGITLILNSLDLNKALKGYGSSQILYIQSRSCLEDAMSKLLFNSSYTGTASITSQGITCQTTVALNGSNSNHRNIELTANDGEFYYSDNIVVDISLNPITIVL